MRLNIYIYIIYIYKRLIEPNYHSVAISTRKYHSDFGLGNDK